MSDDTFIKLISHPPKKLGKVSQIQFTSKDIEIIKSFCQKYFKKILSNEQD